MMVLAQKMFGNVVADVGRVNGVVACCRACVAVCLSSVVVRVEKIL